MEDAQDVAEHYAHGSLEQAILDALSVALKDPSRLPHADLAPVDEFHIGGRQATIDRAQQLPFGPGFDLLDIGCGLGGDLAEVELVSRDALQVLVRAEAEGIELRSCPA